MFLLEQTAQYTQVKNMECLSLNERICLCLHTFKPLPRILLNNSINDINKKIIIIFIELAL